MSKLLLDEFVKHETKYKAINMDVSTFMAFSRQNKVNYCQGNDTQHVQKALDDYLKSKPELKAKIFGFITRFDGILF